MAEEQDAMMAEMEQLRQRMEELQSKMGTDGTDKKRTENARMTVSKGKEIGDDEGSLGGAFEFKESPEFIEKRLAVYDRIKAKRDAEQLEQPREKISITLPDGAVVEGTSFETSPMDIALGISKGLANTIVVAKVFYSRRIGATQNISDSSGFEVEEEEDAVDKGELWDLVRPLEGDCKLNLLKFDDREAKMVFWHSSAHILGECIECKFGSHLTVGPPIDPGFYYDTYVGREGGVTDTMMKTLTTKAKAVVKEKQKFERLVISKEEALELFADNPYKVSFVKNKVPDGTLTTAYRCGPLVDLCMGPHIPDTGKVKCFEVTKASTAYWLGNVQNDPLQRIYGISFPDKKMLTEHKKFLEEAEKNDHRRKGEQQKLFFFHHLSPGSAFFLPHGARIYTTLLKFLRDEYFRRGYTEVVTPNIYNSELWKTSGHWEHYRDDMFTFTDADKAVFGLKPMNCPGHCLMFGHSRRSFRELPVRYADFGVLHRNEASGALTGLTRVRRFQQDDGHIFCSPDDLVSELMSALNFMKYIYDIFGMTYKLERSTRPAKACGIRLEDGSPNEEGLKLWDTAEDALAKVLDTFAGPGNWRDNPGDGAFYGPKIDIKVYDSMKRIHQCATVQLDFQNPINFDLHFEKSDGTRERPVMIHRAMLGSVERMIAVLTEHFKGRWPFWLSPRQAIVICVHPDHQDFARTVHQQIHDAGFYCDIDLTNRTMKKQILMAQSEQYNFMLIVGAKEREHGGADVRLRTSERVGLRTVDEIISLFSKYRDEFVRDTTSKEEYDLQLAAKAAAAEAAAAENTAAEE
mmetsp:Transcript_4147/g.7262  ORF Transcript_4147/g.7262 Transcript_4147/m.7262 type:complete len:803 (-) Transcript_4147:84-2492(-)